MDEPQNELSPGYYGQKFGNALDRIRKNSSARYVQSTPPTPTSHSPAGMTFLVIVIVVAFARIMITSSSIHRDHGFPKVVLTPHVQPNPRGGDFPGDPGIQIQGERFGRFQLDMEEENKKFLQDQRRLQEKLRDFREMMKKKGEAQKQLPGKPLAPPAAKDDELIDL